MIKNHIGIIRIMLLFVQQFMRKEISSGIGYIVFYKISNLLIFGVIFSVLIWHLILDFRLVFSMIGSGIFFVYIIFWGLPFLFRISKVELAENGFFVNRAGLYNKKEIFVPFENVKSISQDLSQRGKYETITIELIEPAEMGSEIVFFPKSDSPYWFKENPLVEELNLLIRSR